MPITTARRGTATLDEGAVSAARPHTAGSFLGDVIDLLARLVESSACSILLLEDGHLHDGASRGLASEYVTAIDGLEIGPEVGSCGAAAYYGQTSVSEDVELDERWADFRELTREFGIRSCWSVPLKLPDGTVLGTFASYTDHPFAPDPEQIETVEAYASIVALGLDSVRRKAELAASYESAVVALTSALDVRDDYTGTHSTATSRLVRDVCVRLELSEPEIEMVGRAAALHDVGKLGVPTEILTSPDALTPEQERIMRDHPVIGEQILRQIPGMEKIADAVRHEHERWDGKGYPDGLAGELIPLASRIIFACDAYDAMTSDRPYRSALEHTVAIAELRDNAGSQFDPHVVAALLEVLGNEGLVLGCEPGEDAESDRREALEAIAAEIGAEDVFVFRKVARDTFSHLAGIGRGEGWAGNIELREEDVRFGPTLESGRAECIAEDEPVRIVGPYYARSAVIAPCSHDVIVVFGSSTESLAQACERDMVGLAQRVARLVDDVPSAKRLADELEVLDAVRAVTTVNADGVDEALDEISERAATALSCEFGAVVVTPDTGPPRIGWSDRGWLPAGKPAAARELLAELAVIAQAAGRSGVLIQDTSEPGVAIPDGFGADQHAASLHAVPIGNLAVLVTVHAQPSPRGFTNLCQRVARSVADCAELVIRRALAQERLFDENAELERRARTDPLTGLQNRGGWDDVLVRVQAQVGRDQHAVFSVALFDLDGLKAVNDTHGHPAGDDLLRAFAIILDGAARGGDYVARIGGDEFGVMLHNCDRDGAIAWCRRVEEAAQVRNASTDASPVEVSWGCASIARHGSISAAIAEADSGLYGDKAD